MSFDLYVFPPPGPTTIADAHRLIEADQDLDGRAPDVPARPDPEMASFLAELERRWPTLEEDVDASPWSSSLWHPDAGGGTELNISWPWAESMRPAILDIAARTKVTVYDPQADQLIRPPDDNPVRRFFKRRG